MAWKLLQHRLKLCLKLCLTNSSLPPWIERTLYPLFYRRFCVILATILASVAQHPLSSGGSGHLAE